MPNVVDLFCGAGGLSEGFRAAGFSIRAGFDYSKLAMETYLQRFKSGECIKVQNLSGATLEAWKERIGDVHVLIGGPSCQGYSTSGGLSKSGGRDKYDPRNSLFTEYVRLADALKPNWLVMENVTGLLLYNHGEVAREVCVMLEEIGYRVRPMILLAADYGVPQLRRRLIFVGNRTGSPIRFPTPTHGNPKLWKRFSLPFSHLSRIGNKNVGDVLPHIGFDEACGDLPVLGEGETIDDAPYPDEPVTAYQRLMREGSDSVKQHISSRLCETDRSAATLLKPGQNWRHLPAEVRPARFNRIRPYDATTLMKRLEPDKPAYTITTKFNEASTGAFIHPHQRRTISVREAARLQSFPDNFRFAGQGSQLRRQIGNAVPPMLAQALAEVIQPVVCQEIGEEVTAPSRAFISMEDTELADILQLHGARKTIKDYENQQLSLL